MVLFGTNFQLNTYCLMNGKMVIPFKARKRILKALHIPHNGIDKTRVAARQLYYWSKMNQQVKQLIKICDVCQRFRPSQQLEPPMMTESNQAFDAVGADLFYYNGRNYLVLSIPQKQNPLET